MHAQVGAGLELDCNHVRVPGRTLVRLRKLGKLQLNLLLEALELLRRRQCKKKKQFLYVFFLKSYKSNLCSRGPGHGNQFPS